LGVGARQVEAPGLVLFDRRYFGQKRVKFSVVAENDPALGSNFGEPFVIRSSLRKFELVFGIVVMFDGKGRPGRPDSFRKALSKVSVKIER
jgi:hypothetical protein